MTENNLTKTATVYNNLKDREEYLLAEIEKLKTDRGIEEEIRERYGMVKANEEVIVVVDDANIKSRAIDSKSGWWQIIKNWFK